MSSKGIVVKKSHWRQGLGRQMMRELITRSEVLGAEKINLAVGAPNTGAIALYQSLGFVTEGVLKDDFIVPSGEYVDELLMGLFLKKKTNQHSESL